MFSTKTTKKTWFSKILLFISCVIGLSMTSCRYSEPTDVVISASSIIVDNKEVEINCPSPLSRQKNTASVRIDIEGDWEPVPPWTSIKFSDGSVAEIKVTLIADNQQKFKASVIGLAGGMLDARFDPQFPKKLFVKKILIYSSSKVVCKKIIWHDFNRK